MLLLQLDLKLIVKELELFKERNVCIIFDADEAGQNGAIKLQNQLKSVLDVCRTYVRDRSIVWYSVKNYEWIVSCSY